MEAYELINITTARKILGDIVAKVNKTYTAVCLSRRTETVAVFPGHYIELLSKAAPLHKKMALTVVEHFFAEAPGHIKAAQLSDVENLSVDKLIHFLKIDSLPLEPEQRSELSEILGEKFIERLEKRYEVAQVIINAEKEGLYEMVEHTTGMIDLSR